MLSTRWQPWFEMQSEMGRLRNEMDRLFGRRTPGGSPQCSPAAYPQLNVWEDDGNFFVEAELPGMQLEDLEILVSGNELTIKGQRREPDLEKASVDSPFHLGDRKRAKIECPFLHKPALGRIDEQVATGAARGRPVPGKAEQRRRTPDAGRSAGPRHP